MQDLFGGAIVAAVPGGWLDASDARPVPDHQEVWLERDGAERSVVIEILERVDATDDECAAWHPTRSAQPASCRLLSSPFSRRCAAFHFEEQAVHNDASSSSVLCSNRLAPELTRPSLQERGTCACTALQGTQLLPSGASDAAHPASLLVSLAVLRLATQVRANAAWRYLRHTHTIGTQLILPTRPPRVCRRRTSSSPSTGRAASRPTRPMRRRCKRTARCCDSWPGASRSGTGGSSSVSDRRVPQLISYQRRARERAPSKRAPMRRCKLLLLCVAGLAGAQPPRIGGNRADAPELWRLLEQATMTAERNLGAAHPDPAQWWRQMGNAAQVEPQVVALRDILSRRPHLREGTICEIGFNAGHSAAIWLFGTRARLVEFDLLALPYSAASRAWAERSFAGRIEFHVGNSRATVRDYASRVRNGTAAACDLWLIDGDHGIGARHDLRNALAASKPGTVRAQPHPSPQLTPHSASPPHPTTSTHPRWQVVIADDASSAFPLVRKFWRLHVVVGSIREHGCEQVWATKGRRQLKGWCVGLVQPWVTAEGGVDRLEALYQARLHTRLSALKDMYAEALRGNSSAPAPEAEEQGPIRRGCDQTRFPSLPCSDASMPRAPDPGERRVQAAQKDRVRRGCSVRFPALPCIERLQRRSDVKPHESSRRGA